MDAESQQNANDAWEHHKEEIITLWLAPKSTMLKTMEQMERKHGFCASYDNHLISSNAEG